MADPISLAALQATRRLLLRRLVKLLAWSMPLILGAALTAVVYAAVLVVGLDYSVRLGWRFLRGPREPCGRG
ncbi:exported hypothetical protein [Phycicoccus elongatus Lp2]|jgi:hypothetical protein|uniref:Uncharacterized protein n=1 Tax=Phycicoccus elongatus Lp2 TaxID=1193181 RepID=N0E3C7_9MICO|nr:exported hypothetical protein [Phycicoccus elongatus Lp2]